MFREIFFWGLAIIALAFCGCADMQADLQPGTFWPNAELRRGQLKSQLIVVPGGKNVFRLDKPFKKGRWGVQSSFFDVIYVRLPESLSVGKTYYGNFHKGTFIYTCHASFADWQVDHSLPAMASFKVTEMSKDGVTAEVKLELTVQNPRARRQTGEKESRSIDVNETYRFLPRRLRNMPDYSL